MSKNYKNIGKVKPYAKTMRNWFASILEQTGGMTRYVDMLREKDSKGNYTDNANRLYVEMLDKRIKLEPKEQVHLHDLEVHYVSNTPRPVLEHNPNDCKVLDVLEVNLQDTPKDKEGSSTDK